MQRSIRSLHFAVRPRIVAKHLGQVLVLLAALTCVPAAVSWFSGSPPVANRYFIVILGLLACGAAGSRLQTRGDLQRNEALVILALLFPLTGVVMAIPMTGYGIAFGHALFESISGVTTTGLSTLPGAEELPPALLFARAWMQWIGGLGILVLALAVLVQPGIAAKRLGFDEHEDIAGGTRGHARRIAVVYTLITGLGVVLLLLCGTDLPDAVAHTFTAVSTGGFANYERSLAAFPPAARWAIAVLTFAGAIAFSWYYLGFYKRISTLWRDPQFHGLLIVTSIIAALLYASMWLDDPSAWRENAAHAVLMSISAQTTAGFASLPAAELPPASKLLLTASMLIGGEVGSTAGGLKILRLMILVRLLVYAVQRTCIPARAHAPATVAGSIVTAKEVETLAALLCCYLGLVLVSWLVFLGYGHDPLNALFEVVSAVATAGLSTGVTSPDLHPVLKGVLCADMLLGRIEIFAFLVLLYPGTWVGRRRKAT